MYEGKLVRLRALTSEDAEYAVDWLNDPDTSLNCTGPGRMPQSPDSEREWIYHNSYNAFGIETLDEGRFIGTCSFFDVNRQAGSCSVGILIGEKDARGRGYGKDALLTLLKFLFFGQNMHKAALCVFAYNENAWRMYESVGFTRECIYREQVYAQNRYWDEYAYSMLREEYLEKYGD